MNLQLKASTDLVPWHRWPSYAPSDPHVRYPRLTARSGHRPKLAGRHQLKGQELSQLQNTRPARRHKQLKPIQLP